MLLGFNAPTLINTPYHCCFEQEEVLLAYHLCWTPFASRIVDHLAFVHKNGNVLYLTRITYIFPKNSLISGAGGHRYLHGCAQNFCTISLGFFARFCAEESRQDFCAENGESQSHTHVHIQSLVKLSQHCWRPRWYTYTTSSKGDKVTVNAVQRSTVALCALATFISGGEENVNHQQRTYKSNLAFHTTSYTSQNNNMHNEETTTWYMQEHAGVKCFRGSHSSQLQEPWSSCTLRLLR